MTGAAATTLGLLPPANLGQTMSGLAAPSTAAALQLVPPDALLAIAGHGLGPQIAAGLERVSAGGEMLAVPGVDWRRDVLDWLDGEWGLAIWPPEPGSRGLGGFVLPGIGLFAEVRDPPQVEARLRYLASLAVQHRVVPGEPTEERQGETVVRRLAIAEGLELTWGYFGRWLFLTTSSSRPLARAASAGGLEPTYARLARQLPRPNTGVVYFAIADTLRWLDSLDGSPLRGVAQYDAWWRPLVSPLRTFALATGLPRDGWIEQVAVLEIGR
jgi:hypothetical protein